MDIRQDKLSKRIRDWVDATDGRFEYGQLDRDLGIKTDQEKTTRRVVINLLKKDGIIVKVGDKDGVYRKAENNAPVIPWREANSRDTLNLIWPFGLHELVRILPKNIIVIAGAPDAGKTAFCFNFIRENMDKYDIWYYSSELGALEMKIRLDKFDTAEPIEWKFEARERSSNFADVIKLHPNSINIIDYLEITDNFYLVAGELKAIWESLNKGIAIICLQKKRGAELGRGAEMSLEKPRLYLAMDKGLLKIVKAKNWIDSQKNPNGLAWSFKLVDGCRFVNIQETSL